MDWLHDFSRWLYTFILCLVFGFILGGFIHVLVWLAAGVLAYF